MNNKVSNFLEPENLALQANTQVVERLLEEIWPKVFSSLQILAWDPVASGPARAQSYAQAVSQLLDARLCWFETTQIDRIAFNALADQARLLKADLVICQGCEQALYALSMHKQVLFGGLFTRSPERLPIHALPASLLLPIMPRWPLKRILLVIRDRDFDEVAIVWAIRLAKTSGAHITVLPVISPAPAVYSQMGPDVPALLNSDCSLGRKLRWLARRLVEWEIESVIHLSRELPDEQIRCEVVEGDHDLVVTAAESHNLLGRWMLGDLISSLLAWVDRPLLIAKPRRAQS